MNESYVELMMWKRFFCNCLNFLLNNDNEGRKIKVWGTAKSFSFKIFNEKIQVLESKWSRKPHKTSQMTKLIPFRRHRIPKIPQKQYFIINCLPVH